MAKPIVILIGILVLPAHLVFYTVYAKNREQAYLMSFSLGIGIDGILNTHRLHFGWLLTENAGSERDSDSFTTIPLHECPALEISPDNERQVLEKC